MLNSLGTGNLVLLGIIQGCMLAFDMDKSWSSILNMDIAQKRLA